MNPAGDHAVNRELKIAELLCTRLCHDLTGPIGAIANGVEFLAEEGDKMQDQAIELIGSSAAQAVARLQFYRKAYGRINENGEANLEEIRTVASSFFADGKIRLEWEDIYADAAAVALSYRMTRLLFNILMIASAALLRGGTISVRISATDTFKELSVVSTGKSLKWEKETETILAGGGAFESLGPKTIQLYVTHLLAQELGTRLICNAAENAIEIKAYRPLEPKNSL